MALFRAPEKASMFVSLNVIKALIVMSFTSYLIIGRELDAESALIAQFSITVVFLVIALVIQRKAYKFALNVTFKKSGLIFSIPFLPHVIVGGL